MRSDEEEAEPRPSVCLGSVPVIVPARRQRGSRGAACSADGPATGAYVTSLARMRALPLPGRMPLAPSVTVPMRPWCKREREKKNAVFPFLFFFIWGFDGVVVELWGQRQGRRGGFTWEKMTACTEVCPSIIYLLNWWFGDQYNPSFPNVVFICVCLCTCVSRGHRCSIRPHIDGGMGVV